MTISLLCRIFSIPASLSPCCCWDSSPPCKRCVVVSLPCSGWWCRCQWRPGQCGAGSQVLCGRWHRCAERNCHWCWLDDHRVWSEWGGSPVSISPSTHIALCEGRQNTAVSQTQPTSACSYQYDYHVELINTMRRHDLSRPIRWGSTYKSKNGQLSQFSVADRMELNKLNVCFAPHNQQSGIDAIHEKGEKETALWAYKVAVRVHRRLLNFKLKTTKLNNLGTSTDIFS